MGSEAAKPLGCNDQKQRVEVFQKELIFEREKGWTANRQREE
jgi:hypothetical protein